MDKRCSSEEYSLKKRENLINIVVGVIIFTSVFFSLSEHMWHLIITLLVVVHVAFLKRISHQMMAVVVIKSVVKEEEIVMCGLAIL